jgi:RNA recognition motif-containing protein
MAHSSPASLLSSIYGFLIFHYVYRGPPADWFDSPPPFGTEIFVGRIPREFNLEHIIPIFEKIGTIYELRLLMDFSRSNRGFGFVRYTTVEDAQKAVRTLDNFKIG